MRQHPGKEESAIVLDYLEHGYRDDLRPSHQKTPIVQALGKANFTLLELTPRKEVHLQPQEEVYIGEGKREKIHHIKGRLHFDRLSGTAQHELPHAVKAIVAEREQYFVEFFNKAQPLSTRMHQLELLPGLGKKHMWEVIEARKEQEFSSFKDIKSRVKFLPDPQGIVVKRITGEISGKEKHRIFVY